MVRAPAAFRGGSLTLAPRGRRQSGVGPQAAVLMTLVVSLVMYVIGNSIITAFGLLGALALIRFRNVLKDTRDTVFVFIALVVGMAVTSRQAAVARAERSRAQEEQRRAEQGRARAEQVSRFLIDLFEVSDPDEARGNTVTAREILDDFPEGLDCLITGVGTGGHITACGEALRAHCSSVQPGQAKAPSHRG